MPKESRQTRRAELWNRCRSSVDEKNLKRVTDSANRFTGLYQGMKRQDRRKLARAYFAGKWKNRPA